MISYQKGRKGFPAWKWVHFKYVYFQQFLADFFIIKCMFFYLNSSYDQDDLKHFIHS